MIKTTTEALLKDPAHWREAVKHDHVVAESEAADAVVLLSMQDYERLMRRNREVLRPGDLTDAELDEILKAEPAPEAWQYNHEYKP